MCVYTYNFVFFFGINPVMYLHNKYLLNEQISSNRWACMDERTNEYRHRRMKLC